MQAVAALGKESGEKERSKEEVCTRMKKVSQKKATGGKACGYVGFKTTKQRAPDEIMASTR